PRCAVSQDSILQDYALAGTPEHRQSPADLQSAIRQISNLRYAKQIPRSRGTTLGFGTEPRWFSFAHKSGRWTPPYGARVCCNCRTRFIAATISFRRRSPNQIVCVPGCPSPFRPKNPPKLATIRMVGCKGGGLAGTFKVRLTKRCNAFHSSSSNTLVHGRSGCSRPR